MEDRNLRTAFHRALDEVAPPAPWLMATVRQDLHTRRGQGWAARARRKPVRARFAIAGLALVALAVATLSGVLLTKLHEPIQVKHPTPQVSPSPPIAPIDGSTRPIYQDYGLAPVKMTSPTTGWAMGGLRTTDGGQHWRDVSPPSLPGNPALRPEFYLDALHAWKGQMFSDHLVIFRTTDGGKNWEQGSAISFPAKDQRVLGAYMAFVDAGDGWLLTESWPMGEPHPDPTVSALYRTTNGGINWMLLATEPGRAAPGCYFSQGLAFVTPSTGWVEIFCPQQSGGPSRLMVTRDGGTTWKVDSVANNGLCAPCTYSPPTIIDSQHWLVLLVGEFYVTENGGATWDRRELPGNDLVPPPGELGGPRGGVSFIDPNMGWAFVWLDTKNASARSSRLYRTTDGGRHWTLIQSNLPVQAPDGATVIFVDAKNGFAAHRLSTSGVQLLKTNDGGQSWTEIQYQLVAPNGT